MSKEVQKLTYIISTLKSDMECGSLAMELCTRKTTRMSDCHCILSCKTSNVGSSEAYIQDSKKCIVKSD